MESLSPRAFAGVAAVAVVVYALAAWFLFISPKRAEATTLSSEIAAANVRLNEARAAANRTGGVGVQVSEILRLAKAMPSANDQPGLLLELSGLADSSGVTLNLITPSAPARGLGGATMIPVDLTVSGGYFQIAKFLKATRSLVAVRRGQLRAVGRLFAIEKVELAAAQDGGFPKLDAFVRLNAYVYDGPVVPAEAPQSPEDLVPTGSTAAGRTSS